MGVKIVEYADNCIGTLPRVNCLIHQEVDLSRYCLTTYPEDGTLPWCEEINRPWLLWIAWIVDLLEMYNYWYFVNYDVQTCWAKSKL